MHTLKQVVNQAVLPLNPGLDVFLGFVVSLCSVDNVHIERVDSVDNVHIERVKA